MLRGYFPSLLGKHSSFNVVVIVLAVAIVIVLVTVVVIVT